MTSFLVMWFSNLHIMWNFNGLSACKVSILQVVFDKFYRQIKKKMTTSSWRHFMFFAFENLSFVKFIIAYQPCRFQISLLSGSNFMEVSVRPPKITLWRHFYHWVSKLVYFVELVIDYQPSKFQCFRMSGSNFMEGGWKTPPQSYKEIRKPSAYKVKVKRVSTWPLSKKRGNRRFRFEHAAFIWNH